jgi:hypothetical protein
MACSSKSTLSYYFSLTPPHLCTEAYSIVDEALRNFGRRLQSPPESTPPPVSPERQARADAILALAPNEGGAGLIPASITGPIAYLVKIQASCPTPTLPATNTFSPQLPPKPTPWCAPS